VSGSSGIGKSSVVNELQKAVIPSRGLFASGKFDQFRRDVPYATFAQAFQRLVREILSKGDVEIAYWRIIRPHNNKKKGRARRPSLPWKTLSVVIRFALFREAPTVVGSPVEFDWMVSTTRRRGGDRGPV